MEHATTHDPTPNVVEHPDIRTWKCLHGEASNLCIGSLVQVSEDHPYWCDWRGTMVVVGLAIDPDNSLNITIATALTYDSDASEGWSIDNLEPSGITGDE